MLGQEWQPSSYSTEQIKIEIDFFAFMKEHHVGPGSDCGYYDAKIEQIKKGEPTFVLRDQQGEGAVYDFFDNNQHIGFVDCPGDGISAVYLTDGDASHSCIAEYADFDYKRNLMLAVERITQHSAEE